jgi:hypothetical protein
VSRSFTLSDVPAGIVTSRTAGTEGSGFDAGCARPAAVDSPVAGAVPGLDASACAGAGDAARPAVSD